MKVFLFALQPLLLRNRIFFISPSRIYKENQVKLLKFPYLYLALYNYVPISILKTVQFVGWKFWFRLFRIKVIWYLWIWSDTLGTKMFATSILIFDSYGMKSLYLKFGHPCQIFWSWVYCIALNWQHDDIDIDATSNSKRTYVQLDSFDLWSQQSYFRQESEMGRTYHRTPFKSCTSLYSPEAKMGSQKVTRKKKTIYSARWPLSLPSVFLSSKIPKVDVSFQCTMNLFFLRIIL